MRGGSKGDLTADEKISHEEEGGRTEEEEPGIMGGG